MEKSALRGGYTNLPIQSSLNFREIMMAMAKPGKIRTLTGGFGPEPLSISTSNLILTLCDPETKISLLGKYDREFVRDWIVFHTNATFSLPAEADFVIGTWKDIKPLSQFKCGTEEYPDRSATIILETEKLENLGISLRGPGIKTSIELTIPDRELLYFNQSLYPMGLDFFLCCNDKLSGLPRSTRLVEI